MTKIDGKYIEAVGRRKTSIARVRMWSAAKLEFEVNGKTANEYFKTDEERRLVVAPFEKGEAGSKWRISVKVVNTSKIRITPRKLEEIYHTRYSGSPGGLRVIKAKETAEKKGYPELLKLAIYHMLPGNKLRRQMMKNLIIEE